MEIKGIAINADAGKLDGDLNRLRQSLDYFQNNGYRYVELAPHSMGMIINGGLFKKRMAELLHILAGYPFHYTVHGPNPLNLMNQKAGDIEKKAFLASLEFTAAVGSQVMVYHAGRYVPEEDFLLPHRAQLTPSDLKSMWKLERMLLQEMGKEAERLGITIAVENARPYLDASPYCYAEFLNELTKMIEEVNHPKVGITLDTGHAYLSANHHGYSLMEGIKLIAPHVRHIHLHDNFGQACASYENKQYDLTAMGRGDLHMPIGWGTVPISDILSHLGNYVGVITLELRSWFSHYLGEALQNTQSMIQTTKMVA